MTGIEVIQQEKAKLAEKYVESFKTELTDIQANIFSRFQDKVESLILSTEPLGNSIDDLPLTDEEKKFLYADPAIAQKLFLFIKDKNQDITTAQTVEELEKLSSESQTLTAVAEGGNRSAVKDGVVTGAIGGGTVLGTYKIHNWIDARNPKSVKNLFEASVKETTIEAKNAETMFGNMKGQFSELSQKMDVRARNPKLTKLMQRNLRKSVKVFEQAAKGLDDGAVSAFATWSKLGEKLPYSVIKSIKPSQATALMGVTEEAFKEISATQDLTQIKKILNVGELSDETVQCLKSAKTLDEFKGMSHCLTQARGLKAVMKGIRGVALLDVIALGMDVWMYEETMNQADEIKKINEIRGECMKNKANAQLRIGIGGAALSIAVSILATSTAIGSVIPGFGTIVGFAVGATVAGVYQIVESYYENVDFYAQNQEDYKRKYKTEIKQAIIQTASAESFGRHQNIRSDIALQRKENGQSIEMVQDAWSALLWQEELEAGGYPLLQQWQNSGRPEAEFTRGLPADKATEYAEQTQKITSIINKRLEYIRQYMYENGDPQQIQSFAQAMKGAQGLSFIDNVVAQSKVYYLKADQSSDQYITGFENKSVNEYIQAYGEKLQQEDPKLFEKLKTISQSNRTRFIELYQGSVYRGNINKASAPNETAAITPSPEDVSTVSEETPSEELVADAETETETLSIDEQTTMQKHADYIKRFYQLLSLGTPAEQMSALQLNFLDVDYNYVESFLKDIDHVDTPSAFGSTEVRAYFVGDALITREQSNIEVSDSIGQNVLYRLAKEVHGYTGANDMMQLMNFYAPGKGNATGIYYDGKRFINNDRAIDQGFDLDIFDDPKATTQDIMKSLINATSRQNIALQALVPNPIAVIDIWGFRNDATAIDTPTENMDNEMNVEFWTRFKKIVEEERGFRGPEIKKNTEQEIVDFVRQGIQKNVSADGPGYVEMPYYLIIKAKKAGIGDLSKFLFTWRNDTLIACGNKAYVDMPLDFSSTKTPVSKEFVSNMREDFTPEEKKYIEYVDEAHARLEELRNIQGTATHEDELDLPKDFEILLSKKWKERERLKKNLLSCDPTIAVNDMLKAQYQVYHDYFENMYMAILSEVSIHKYSNDIDGYSYMMSVMDKMQRGLFDLENKTLLTGVLTEDESKIFYKVVASEKVFGKTIADLVKSSSADEQAKGYRGAKQVLKTILEIKTLKLNDSFAIEGIYTAQYAMSILESIQKLSGVQKVRQLLLSNLDEKKFFVPPEITGANITKKSLDELKIMPVTDTDTQTMNAAKAVSNVIETTLANVVRQGKRGELLFDPETKKLTSRSRSIEIDPTTLKIKGLDIAFKNLNELISVANMVNRMHYKYPGTKDFYFGSRIGSGVGYGIYKSESGLDTQILDNDTIKAKFPSLLNANNDVRSEFIQYINS